jgi:hypothetical protein
VGIRIFGEYIFSNHIEIEAIETCLQTRSYKEESQEMFRSCRSILHDVLQEEVVKGSIKFISSYCVFNFFPLFEEIFNW